MVLDKTTIETYLKLWAQHADALRTAITERERAVVQLSQKITQMTDEIKNNNGALGYIDMITKTANEQLEELAKTPPPPTSPAASF